MQLNLIKQVGVILFLGLVLNACKESPSNNKQQNSREAYSLVNPFVGTGGHGHTYPGATLPFGMVQLSPDTRLEGWDGCSGYHYTDSVIYGFSHTHLSGTGVSDYGDILLMPTQGNVQFDNGYKTGLDNGYASLFRKETEKATPGYYEVHLEQNNIDVRLTTTKRVGIHEYTFNEKDTSNILLDLVHRDKLLDCNIKIVNEKEIEGFRISEGWATEQHLYFVIQSSKKFNFNEMKEGVLAVNEETTLTRNNKLALRFINEQGEKIMLKVGVSAVSIGGARKNLEEEAAHWDFDQYLSSAQLVWTNALGKIEAKGGTEEQLAIFYTSLYHSMLAPNLFSDVDDQYRGTDLKIHQSKDGPVYTVFSLWDTFRGAHPLYSIIEEKKTNEFIRTFLKQYQEGRQLPIWELAGNYTGCMIGYHSIPVIADAYNKGIRDYDTDLAMEAMLHSARMDKLGLESYKRKGYIAAADEAESVSRTLEYAYDDWCIAVMAEKMDNKEVFEEFIQRGQYYKNIFNNENGFMQSKMNSGWRSGFDPGEVNFNFTEANSWQYSMFVPQDIKGLIALHGGNKKFEEKLDELFSTEMELSGRHQADITGLIGQYAHGNEPSHHMAYLYNYVGKPYKTQERVHQILDEQYQNAPDGLSGNEDCGQMSAWYVLSAMGFYSVTPGLTYYTIGTPLFDEVTINLENNNKFVIKANNISKKNKYIQKATLNGKELDETVLYHKQIMDGGELVFEMGGKPNQKWGADVVPVSEITKENIMTPIPYFSTPLQTFKDSFEVEIKSVSANAELFYKIAGVNDDFVKYEKPITIRTTSEILTYAVMDGKKSFETKATYKKIDGDIKIKLMTAYDNQYNAGGDEALIDNLKGGSNFRTDFWQGYYGKDVIAVLDLGKLKSINKVTIGALQDIKSWIWFPQEIELFSSKDGSSFFKLGVIKNDFSDSEYGAFTKEYEKELAKSVNCRYVKVVAKNYGQCPDWHLGKGADTWLFLDEITVE